MNLSIKLALCRHSNFNFIISCQAAGAVLFSEHFPHITPVCPADSVPAAESGGGEESIQLSAQPDAGHHHHAGDGAAAAESFHREAAGRLPTAAGHQDEAGTGDR